MTLYIGAPPCTEFNVSQLVDHLAGNLALACKALGSEQADDPSLAPEPRIAQLAQAALESFSARGLEGTLDPGFAMVPASVLSGILTSNSWSTAGISPRPRARNSTWIRAWPSKSWNWRGPRLANSSALRAHSAPRRPSPNPPVAWNG
ncbi:DinB family protein [Glutamicibacter nicotianae]|uniref:hypothetical protein n=1 Tax=Glutamicibacter nicotianae TaxID=37929 RepID=UPI00167F226F|nr:hypothetical protein [Glutamicibacter nicotianae]